MVLGARSPDSPGVPTDTTCPKCGGATADGIASAHGLLAAAVVPEDTARLVFVVPGTPTSPNPIKAFAQGLADDPSSRAYLLTGRRCTRCGFVELYADVPTRPPGA
jgi:hypothetical protein